MNEVTGNDQDENQALHHKIIEQKYYMRLERGDKRLQTGNSALTDCTVKLYQTNNEE